MHVYRLTLLAILLGSAPAWSQNNTSFYIEPGSFSTRRESDPPAYVRNLGQTPHDGPGWFDFGLQQRLRYEYRDDDVRRLDVAGMDDRWLSRTRVYVGMRNRVDPLRFSVEFQDARRFASRYAPDSRDTNKAEFIQGYAELYLADRLSADPRGNKRPVSIRLGRQAFDLLDRRLAARNEWRNTTNTFEGLRATIGEDRNDWQIEFMSFRPLTRLLSETDSADRNVRFTALVGHWRRAPHIMFEPHYFYLKQAADPANGNTAREIHAPGLRVYGNSTDGAANYDVTMMTQYGDDGTQDHVARAFTGEISYTWQQHPWRPRVSAFYGYASGDDKPADRESGRFERFFGFARPWSASEYVVYENLRAPKLRLEFQPFPGVRVDAGYGAYWLARSTDRFNNLLGGTPFNRDLAGRSGSFVGDEVDARVRLGVGAHVDVTVGYAHFMTGEFVRDRQNAASQGSPGDADFLYLEFVASLF